jgi:hypothetical protein
MFGVTPAVLILLLRPYGFEVTARCLTDWRQKGLLPQLSSLGLGYRNGVLKYWDPKEIVRMALEVCRKLKGPAGKRGFGRVRRSWLAGADIPASRARSAWVRDLDRRMPGIRAPSLRCSTEVSKSLNVKSRDARDIVEEVVRSFVQPNYQPGTELDIGLVCRFFCRFSGFQTSPNMRLLMTEQFVTQCLIWVNAVFSPAGYRSLLASATPTELDAARDEYWAWWSPRKISMPDEIGPDSPCHLFAKSCNGFLEALALLLAALVIPLLLPSKTTVARLAASGAR